MNFILATSYLYFFFSHPDSLVCVSEDRNAACLDEAKPVCVLYSGGDCESVTGFCQRTVTNGCVACLDANVAGYILGECEDVPVQACSHSHLTTECQNSRVEGNVCGISVEYFEMAEITKEVFDDGCDACNWGSGYYLAGEAREECMVVSTSTICRDADRRVTNCPTDDGLKACAYYPKGTNGCTEPICRMTVDSYCHACIEPDVLFYLNGRCEDNVPISEEGLVLAAPEVEGNKQNNDPEEIEAINFLI